MNYQKTVNFLLSKFENITLQEIQMLWNIYQTYIEVLIEDEEEQQNLLEDIYRYQTVMTEENLANVFGLMNAIQGKLNQLSFKDEEENVEEVLLDYLTKYGYHEKVSTQQFDSIKDYIHHQSLKRYQELENQKEHAEEYFSFELASFSFSNDFYLYQVNIDISAKIYHFIKQHFMIEKEEKLDDLKNDIIISYDCVNNPNLSYQQRLNFVLGFIQPEPETLYHQAMFLVEYYNNLMIPKKYKDMYFLQGYFHSFEPYSENYECQDVEYLNGKDYFSDCMNDNKMEVLVENVNDYFHDLNHKNKNVMFLYGILVKGTQLYEQSVEKQEKTLYYS